MKLRMGSRGSQLALWQANHIAALLRGQGHEVEIEIIKTTGDRLQEVTFAQVGSKGMFTKEIEEALAEGRVDLAVHSLKDLPTELPEPFVLAATPPRVDPRDVLVSVNYGSLAELPQGAKVGTSSQRRPLCRHGKPCRWIVKKGHRINRSGVAFAGLDTQRTLTRSRAEVLWFKTFPHPLGLFQAVQAGSGQ